MDVIAIDPGPVNSAYVFMSGGNPVEFGKCENIEIKRRVMSLIDVPGVKNIVCEKVASYGMPVGAEVFETVFFSGELSEMVISLGAKFERIPRMEVKMHLCHQTKGVNDSVIRQALVDRFGPGKEKAIGTKKSPGPCYGITKDCWQALALGVVWCERNKGV